jgi:hypothetical protein
VNVMPCPAEEVQAGPLAQGGAGNGKLVSGYRF